MTRDRFVKRAAARQLPMFEAEAEGLRALAAAGARVPRVIAVRRTDEEAAIEMESLALGAPPDWPALARMLAALHRAGAPRFGWDADNWIGLSPQANGWDADWTRFWFERRLGPQCARARKRGFILELAPLRALLDGHRPAPSLLHGDLWRGNVGFVPGGPVIYDPAVYYGDREADLAMTELFGGFPRAFYEAYAAAWPLPPGYPLRRDLYNLYHVLNHLNLFGGGYLGQAHALAERLLDAVRA